MVVIFLLELVTPLISTHEPSRKTSGCPSAKVARREGGDFEAPDNTPSQGFGFWVLGLGDKASDLTFPNTPGPQSLNPKHLKPSP